MLSYRHAFHAGNHADVFKHLILSLLVRSLLRKDKPFFFLDTHAGAGRYDLSAPMATLNREHDSGIGRLRDARNPPAAVADYLALVRRLNPGRETRWYPGSPRIVRPLLRPGDRMVLAEMHPADSRVLAREFADDRQVRVETTDGYQLLKALLPPPERRGLVHIDPAYERKDERPRLLEALREGHRRWATGIYAVWYPIQDRTSAEDFVRHCKRLALPRMLLAEFRVLPEDAFHLTGSGMLIVNPPWQLDIHLRETLPWLAARLAPKGDGSWRVAWLTDG